MKIKCGILKAFLLVCLIFFIGCDSTNRKQFSRLEPIKKEDGYQYFRYITSTGSGIVKCYGKSCFIKPPKRAAKWPLESKEAEQVRIKWLENWLVEQGYVNIKYEIVSRDMLFAQDALSAGGRFDLCYDVKIKTP